jgi:hypothetical protein
MDALSTRLHYVQMAFADPDTWGYLAPALSQLSGSGFQSVFGRTFVYPLFVTLILGLTKSFTVLAIAQEITTFVAAGLLGAILFQSSSAATPLDVKGVVYKILSVLFMWLYIQATPSLFYERLVRPEAISPVFMALLLYCIFIYYRNLSAGQPGSRPFFLICLLNALLYFLKPNWGLALLSPLVVFGTGLAYEKISLRKSAVCLCVFLFTLLLFYVPQQIISGHNRDQFAEVFLPRLLFTSHADGVQQEIEKDIQTGDSPFDINLLKDVNDMLIKCLHGTREVHGQLTYPTFTFNPDIIMWSEAGLASTGVKLLSPTQQKEFYFHYFVKYITSQPRRYLKKIIVQLGIYYAPFAPQYKIPCGWHEGALIGLSLFSLSDYAQTPWATVPSYVAWVQRQEDLRDVRGFVFPCYEATFRVLNILYWPVLLLVCIGCSARALLARYGRISRPKDDNILPLLLVSTFVICFLIDFSTAVLHSLDILRYVEFHFVLTLFLEISALGLLFSLLADLVRQRRFRVQR